MSARYYTLVSDELLPQLRGPLMPACLRLVRVIEAPTRNGMQLVEFEDDEAPEELNGKNVEPWMTREFDLVTMTDRVWISKRLVVESW